MEFGNLATIKPEVLPSLLPNLFWFVISCLVLIVAGIYLVKALSKIARFLGISEFSAAFIIMAFASSIPELFVGLSSAFAGTPALSLGNIIGANIIDLTLISGIIIILSKEIKINSRKVGKDIYFMLGSILLMIVLYVIGNSLSRIDGFILLVVFLFHTYNVFNKRKKYPKKIKKESGMEFWWLLIFILALIGLFISSNFVVKFGSNLAIDLGLPEIMLGLFIISIATTLPELVFGISASGLKHKEMAVGDQVGAVVIHSTLIIGIVAIISPITTEFMPFIISSIFMFISAFIFVTFLKTGQKLEKIEGVSLILIYVLFVMIEFFAK